MKQFFTQKGHGVVVDEANIQEVKDFHGSGVTIYKVQLTNGKQALAFAQGENLSPEELWKSGTLVLVPI
ncbi:hypothetical protein ACJU26_08685 [Acidithiobacillus sp. M4-SHS-6]|uniref:hypothetical protein n=1 Tax=Acidithiobacillus sp. M4-SHS-6 TaxID=3383024 RepID=UPI0039BEBA4C